MSELTIRKAKKMLEAEAGDSEGYHAVYDDILEGKLYELDPKFMLALKKLYEDSGEARWYA